MNDSTVLTSLPSSDSASGTTQHYDGCPCATCQTLRAAQPVATAMQARHLSGAAIGKLVEYEISRNLTTGERQWSPPGHLVNVWHAENSTEIAIEWGADYDQAGLNPNDWVRITTAGEDAA